MLVNNEQEALFIACEMERRAISLYQRAALVIDDDKMKAAVEEFMKDESEHLARFRKMGQGLPRREMNENQLLLSAYAAQVLYPGGLVEASREHALDSEGGLTAYALTEEKKAVACYTAFARQCAHNAVKEMFLQIAKEEAQHQLSLEKRLKALG